MKRLWHHQAAAAGGRATIVAACGTGKTITAAETSRRLAPAGNVLAVIPGPGLLTPAAAEWESWLGPDAGQVAVCGPTAAAAGFGQPPGRAAVASPASLALLLASRRRVTVLTGGPGLPLVAAAHRDHGAPPWDLLIADDAHLTADGPAWAAVHHDELIPAARRLYLTAAASWPATGSLSCSSPAPRPPQRRTAAGPAPP